MDERQHTPGKWKAGEAAWYRGRAKDDTESGKRPITSAGHPVIANAYGRANAERIVACVNACEGLADPQATITALVDEIDTLCQAIEGHRGGSLTNEGLWHYRQKARAALAGEPK